MKNNNYDNYFVNFKINKSILDKVLLTLSNKDLSWPFGVTKDFEEAASKFLNVKYSLAHCNGTSAMYAAMFAVGVKAGSEVICPTYTFWASISPAVNLGAKVVFCDVNKTDFLININSLKRCITNKTKAIIIPHLWGNFCDLNKIRKICNQYPHKIYIIEDASHCFGAKYKKDFLGTLGDVGIFSLQAGKPLVAGEGGLLVTNNFQIYDRAVYFGHYERIKFLPNTSYSKYMKTGGGYKFRIHPLASAIAILQLNNFDIRMAKHNKLMAYFESKLSKIKNIEICKETYKNFTYGGRFGLRILINLTTEKKLNFIKECEKLNLRVENEYMPLLHLEEFFKDSNARNIGKGKFVNTENAYNKLLSLPVFYNGDSLVIDKYVKEFSRVLSKFIY